MVSAVTMSFADGAHQDIRTKLVGLVLQGCVLLKDDCPDLTRGLADTLLKISRDDQTTSIIGTMDSRQ